MTDKYETPLPTVAFLIDVAERCGLSVSRVEAGVAGARSKFYAKAMRGTTDEWGRRPSATVSVNGNVSMQLYDLDIDAAERVMRALQNEGENMTDADTVREMRNILEDWTHDRATPMQAFDRLYRLFYPPARATIYRYPRMFNTPHTQLIVDGMTVADDGGNSTVGRKFQEIADLINRAEERRARPEHDGG